MDAPIVFRSKDALIRALEERRAGIKAEDREVATRHKAEEREAFEQFKANARDLSKLTYAEAKRRAGLHWPENTKVAMSVSLRLPSCPMRREAYLDRVIRVVSQSTQERYQINRKGRWSDIYRLLVPEEENQTVC